MTYIAADDRYSKIPYRRCGRSGVLLPEISLGLWQNFGDGKPIEDQRAILCDPYSTRGKCLLSSGSTGSRGQSPTSSSYGSSSKRTAKLSSAYRKI